MGLVSYKRGVPSAVGAQGRGGQLESRRKECVAALRKGLPGIFFLELLTVLSRQDKSFFFLF